MYREEKKYYRKAFFYTLIMACVLLLPFVIVDGGYFIFYGDFNAQQIPFYKTCIRAIQEGNFGWNWQTDLGANFIGSYSFYTLGSPFFWLAVLLPASISHYLMAPLLALKLALSSLFAFIYIRRFVRKPDSALVGGILYAFSGFSLYNIFFNHFHEAIVFFPLLLVGLEELVVNKRRGVFVLAVALNAFVNYYFFIGECVFLVIYFIVRLSCDRRFRIGAGDFFCLAFESVVGVALAGALFVPSIFQVLDVPRSTNMLIGSEFMFYEYEQRYGLILEAMFFPTDVAARNSMFPEAEARWSSVALYLPMFSMAGAAAFFRGAKKHWIKPLLTVCLIMMMVPGLNSAFTLFNSSFSMRWLYMAELILSLATVMALERCSYSELKFGFNFCMVAAGLVAVIALFSPARDKENEELIYPRIITDIGVSVPLQLLILALFMVFLGLLIHEVKRGRTSSFAKTTLTLTIISSMVLGYYYVGYGRTLGPQIGRFNNVVESVPEIEDDSFYRIEAAASENNANMFWDMSGLRSFISVVPGSTFELYQLLGDARSVNSQPKNEMYALRSLTNVKYLLVPHYANKEKAESTVEELEIYEFLITKGDYDIYINNYAMPMGFAYDSYVTYAEAEKHSSVDKLMCRAVVLNDGQIEKYSDILTKLPAADLPKVSKERFVLDAQERISAGVTDFTITENGGFSAAASYPQDELVVFSVPYDRGWSAYVNGSPTTVEKVNGGFVAGRVPAGDSRIVFSYTTPGLWEGLILTAGGAVLYGFYMLIQYAIMRRKPRKYAHLYDRDIVEGVTAHSSYITQVTKQVARCAEKGRIYRPDVNEAEYEAIRRSLAESAARVSVEKRPSAFHLNDGEEAMEILKSIEKKRK